MENTALSSTNIVGGLGAVAQPSQVQSDISIELTDLANRVEDPALFTLKEIDNTKDTNSPSLLDKAVSKFDKLRWSNLSPEKQKYIKIGIAVAAIAVCVIGLIALSAGTYGAGTPVAMMLLALIGGVGFIYIQNVMSSDKKQQADVIKPDQHDGNIELKETQRPGNIQIQELNPREKYENALNDKNAKLTEITNQQKEVAIDLNSLKNTLENWEDHQTKNQEKIAGKQNEITKLTQTIKDMKDLKTDNPEAFNQKDLDSKLMQLDLLTNQLQALYRDGSKQTKIEDMLQAQAKLDTLKSERQSIISHIMILKQNEFQRIQADLPNRQGNDLINASAQLVNLKKELASHGSELVSLSVKGRQILANQEKERMKAEEAKLAKLRSEVENLDDQLGKLQKALDRKENPTVSEGIVPKRAPKGAYDDLGIEKIKERITDYKVKLADVEQKIIEAEEQLDTAIVPPIPQTDEAAYADNIAELNSASIDTLDPSQYLREAQNITEAPILFISNEVDPETKILQLRQRVAATQDQLKKASAALRNSDVNDPTQVANILKLRSEISEMQRQEQIVLKNQIEVKQAEYQAKIDDINKKIKLAQEWITNRPHLLPDNPLRTAREKQIQGLINQRNEIINSPEVQKLSMELYRLGGTLIVNDPSIEHIEVRVSAAQIFQSEFTDPGNTLNAVSHAQTTARANFVTLQEQVKAGRIKVDLATYNKITGENRKEGEKLESVKEVQVEEQKTKPEPRPNDILETSPNTDDIDDLLDYFGDSSQKFDPRFVQALNTSVTDFEQRTKPESPIRFDSNTINSNNPNAFNATNTLSTSTSSKTISTNPLQPSPLRTPWFTQKTPVFRPIEPLRDSSEEQTNATSQTVSEGTPNDLTPSTAKTTSTNTVSPKSESTSMHRMEEETLHEGPIDVTQTTAQKTVEMSESMSLSEIINDLTENVNGLATQFQEYSQRGVALEEKYKKAVTYQTNLFENDKNVINALENHNRLNDIDSDQRQKFLIALDQTSNISGSYQMLQLEQQVLLEEKKSLENQLKSITTTIQNPQEKKLGEKEEQQLDEISEKLAVMDKLIQQGAELTVAMNLPALLSKGTPNTLLTPAQTKKDEPAAEFTTVGSGENASDSQEQGQGQQSGQQQQQNQQNGQNITTEGQ